MILLILAVFSLRDVLTYYDKYFFLRLFNLIRLLQVMSHYAWLIKLTLIDLFHMSQLGLDCYFLSIQKVLIFNFLQCVVGNRFLTAQKPNSATNN